MTGSFVRQVFNLQRVCDPPVGFEPRPESAGYRPARRIQSCPTIGIAFLAGAIATLAACGYVGAPLPPALEIPTRISDLRAAQIGERIYVELTLPPLTTEGLPLKSVRSVTVSVGQNPQPYSDTALAANSQPYEIAAAAPGALKCEIPSAPFVGKEVVIRARAVGRKGRTSEWSNLEVLTIVKALERPSGLAAVNVKEGVDLTWKGSGPKYRVYRAAGDGCPEKLGDTVQSTYLDTTSQYGSAYQYYVQALAEEKQQSEVSAPARITPKDEFAPAVPAGLTAIQGVGSIDLAWERNTDRDFKGYNVYRAVEGGPFEKIGELIEAPAFSDRKIESRKKYRYAISAVDLTGNESVQSEPVEITVQ